MNRHDLYKWQQDHQPAMQRSASFSHIPVDRTATLDPSLAHIREPGGFRRNFVVNRAQEQGLEPPTLVRNVVDFLFLYGHFVSVHSVTARLCFADSSLFNPATLHLDLELTIRPVKTWMKTTRKKKKQTTTPLLERKKKKTQNTLSTPVHTLRRNSKLEKAPSQATPSMLDAR